MTEKRGLDIDEYASRSLEIGRGLDSLCDNFYAATQGDMPAEEIQELLLQGRHKTKLFSKLCEDTSGGMQEGLKKKYARYIEEIAEFSKQLDV